mgnify:CR=1 FL=1
MKSIKSMVEEVLLDNVTQSDIEEAVGTIVSKMDISDMLSENDDLCNAVYDAVNDAINSVVEAWL